MQLKQNQPITLIKYRPVQTAIKILHNRGYYVIIAVFKAINIKMQSRQNNSLRIRHGISWYKLVKNFTPASPLSFTLLSPDVNYYKPKGVK
jgi:hypothetical protein